MSSLSEKDIQARASAQSFAKGLSYYRSGYVRDEVGLRTGPDTGKQALAERIMDGGKAKDYDTAVSYLRQARDIYLQHNRQAKWRAYLDDLLTTHQRKYKLVPLLREIR